jgi:predicted Zn-dependent protease
MRLLAVGMLLCAVGLASEFRFSDPDEKLLEQADELDRQFEKKGLVYHDAKADAYLNTVGGRLVGSAVPERLAFRFHILRDPMVNAFALPNGSIYVNTGLVAAMRNEAELAAVLAHEITHATNRHTYLQNRSMRKKAVAMDVIAIAASGAGYFPVGVAFGAGIAVAGEVSQIVLIATVFGYSRELESEADTVGYGNLIRADYDGKAMAQAFELLDERLEFEPTRPFWRTHPKLERRIETAKKLAETENTAHPRETTESDYFANMAPVVRYNIALDLDSRRARTAVDRAQRLVDWAPKKEVDRTLLADSYRSLGAKTPRPDGEELSKEGKETARKQNRRTTPEEEQRALLATDAGKAALLANQAKAEGLYREAMEGDARLADPHRGLGMLYQEEAKYREAATEYRRYLEMAPAQAVDRLRFERRLGAAEKK